MKNVLIIICILLGISLSIFLIFEEDSFIYSHYVYSNEVNSIKSTSSEVKDDFVVMTFGGDVMLDRGVESSVNKNYEGDFSELFKNIDIFNHDDISFVNLEGPVSDVGTNVGSKYSFRMDPKVVSVLKDTGIDIVSFANNHVGDYSMVAFKDTLKRLQAGAILYTGAGENYEQAKLPTLIEKNSIKNCFLAFSDVGPDWMKATDKSAGILIANDKNFIDIITSAKTGCDVLVVSFHWGEEYKPHTKRQETLAYIAIDNGADVVVGAHPHVAQDVEMYKNKPILYSLGNFMFDQSFSQETMRGLVVQMKVYKNGDIKDIKQFTSQQNRTFQIESLEEKI